MKRVLAMLMAVILVAMSAPITAQAATENVTMKVASDKTVANPGDEVNFSVSIGAVNSLGGLEFYLDIPDGLTLDDASIVIPEGLKDTLDSDGDIVVPASRNNYKWSYSAQSDGYAGTTDLVILTFSCKVDSDSAFEEKSVGITVDTCFDNEDLDEHNVTVKTAKVKVEKKKVAVTGVTLNKTTLSMKDGETATLTATVAPSDADNKNVTWTSSDTAVATVTDGTVKALKTGTTKITVKTEDGSKTAECIITVTCNHELNKVDAVDPTCVMDGNVDYFRCVKCSTNFADNAGTTKLTNVTVPATGVHVDTEVRGAVAATEESEGYTGDTYCKTCNNKIANGSTIPVLPHTHAMVKTDAVEPTCNEAGNVAYYTCTKCNKTYSDEAGTREITDVTVPATNNHLETEVRGAVEATEESEGYTGDTYCKKCGAKVTTGSVIPVLPHTHIMVKTDAVAPTCEEEGNVAYYTCTKCNKTYSDEVGTNEITNVVVEATGHTAGSEWKLDETNHWKLCADCEKEMDKAAHSYEWVVDSAATEDEIGYKHEECICGSVRNEDTEIPKLDHVHVDIQHVEKVDATCMEVGNVEYWTCSSAKCEGKYYSDAECQIEITEIELPKDPENHVSDGTWEMDEEKHIRNCTCGVQVDEGQHEYTDDSDSDCNVCGYKRHYVVIEGANGTFELESSNGLVLKADGDHTLFETLEVDGTVVAPENYTVTQGSTVVTLKTEYLNTLAVGSHDIKMLFSDGKVAVTKINIKAKPQPQPQPTPGNNTGNAGTTDTTTNNTVQADTTPTSPKTETVGVGQESVAFVMVMMAMMALTGVVAGKRYMNRKEK